MLFRKAANNISGYAAPWYTKQRHSRKKRGEIDGEAELRRSARSKAAKDLFDICDKPIRLTFCSRN